MPRWRSSSSPGTVTPVTVGGDGEQRVRRGAPGGNDSRVSPPSGQPGFLFGRKRRCAVGSAMDGWD